jgi:hypothetical protein
MDQAPTATTLRIGDKIKCSDMIASVENIRVETTHVGMTEINTSYITVEGQPEISASNLQSFFDQGGFEIIKKED